MTLSGEKHLFPPSQPANGWARGDLYSLSHRGSISNSLFEMNVAYPYCFTSACGNGGAVIIASISGQFFIYKSMFDQNYAQNGAGLCVKDSDQVLCNHVRPGFYLLVCLVSHDMQLRL